MGNQAFRRALCRPIRTGLFAPPKWLIALASEDEPDMTQAQLAKARNEAKASAWQPLLTASQSIEAQSRAATLSLSHEDFVILGARLRSMTPAP
jgi:hypothetical protein